MVPGPDRPDYWLAALERPITWVHDGVETAVTHIVMSARWKDTAIGLGMKSLPLGLAYVLDQSVLGDDRLDMAKCKYIAIGTGDDAAA